MGTYIKKEGFQKIFCRTDHRSISRHVSFIKNNTRNILVIINQS